MKWVTEQGNFSSRLISPCEAIWFSERLLLSLGLEDVWKPGILAPHYDVAVKNELQAENSNDNMLISYEI
jgi:hypothetical protein